MSILPRCVARLGRMRAAWAYFGSWPQLATEFAPLSKTKLTMPVLSIGGEKSLGNQLATQMKLVADNVTESFFQTPVTGSWRNGRRKRLTRCLNFFERASRLQIFSQALEATGSRPSLNSM